MKSFVWKLSVTLLVLSSFLSSCKADGALEIDTPKKIDSLGHEAASNDKDSSKTEQVTIGSGSGAVLIRDVVNKNYIIKPGTYTNIDVINARNVYIDGLNKVKIKGGTLYLNDVDSVVIRAISFEDHSQPVINIYENANNLKLSNLAFYNISNKVINYTINKKYDGTRESFSQNIVLDSLYAENTGPLFESNGGIRDDGFYGLIRNFILSNSTIKNSPDLGNGIYLNLGEAFKIFNNTVDNVNGNHGSHNGIFHVKGNGKIFRNKVTNHQGNAVRSWLFSITGSSITVEIYDNIVYNSSRYSAFEVQVTPDIFQKPVFKPIDGKIFNNTVGRLNTGEPKYYEGRVVDIYATYGQVLVYNNLFFEMRDNIVSLNQSGSETKVMEKNNFYFEKAAGAVFDLETFKSKTANIGAR